jgi:predicted amino acid dehydrogenase
MKFSTSALVAAVAISACSINNNQQHQVVSAFTIHTNTGSYNKLQRTIVPTTKSITTSTKRSSTSTVRMASSSNTAYTIGIVGATGAVGKEIRQVLEGRTDKINVAKLRIFGSERSAGSIVESSKFGSIPVELFSVDATRQCDICFLAVSGDFALQYAKDMSAGDDGCIVIDNSVCLENKCILF